MSDELKPGVYELGDNLVMLSLTDSVIAVGMKSDYHPPERDFQHIYEMIHERFPGKQVIIVRGSLSFTALGESTALVELIEKIVWQVIRGDKHMSQWQAKFFTEENTQKQE